MTPTTEHDIPKLPNEAEDERALRALFRNLQDAWNAGDAEAYAALFTPDADYIAFDGVNQKGREAVAAAHRPLFGRWLRGSSLTGEVTRVRRLGPDAALLHASGGTVLAGRAAPDPARTSVQSLVALRQGGGWRFCAFHNTRVRPIAGFRGVLLWGLTDALWRPFGGGAQAQGAARPPRDCRDRAV